MSLENKVLVCTVGLPRSGKTMWAKQQGVPIVNPDSIRLALHGKRYEQLAEPFVWAIAKTMVRALFLAGHDFVIVDATNTTAKRRDEWKDESWITLWKILDTSVDVCKQRALDVGDSEIIPIIERMSEQFSLPTGDLYEGDCSSEQAS